MNPLPNTLMTAISRPSREHLTAMLARNRKRLGLTRTELFTLERLMGATDHRSWSDAAGIPVCWIRSRELASRHAVERGSWRRVERQLEAKGFIQCRTPANNFRGAIRSSKGTIVEAFGIYFPFLDRLDQLHAIDAARAKSEDLLRRLTAEARAWRGRWVRLIHSLGVHVADIHGQALAVYEEHTRGKRAYASYTADQLRQLRAFAESEIEVITQKLAQREMNASGVKVDRAITENEQEEKSVRDPCSRGVPNDARASSSDRYTQTATRYVERMTEEELEKLCSPGMRELLAIRNGHQPTVSDFRRAAATRAQAIGISDSLWVRACAEMGRDCATIALIVIDRNLAHPTIPVRSAAGVLHAMIQRQKAGFLNLAASIYALSRRAKVIDRRRPGLGGTEIPNIPLRPFTSRPWRA